MANRQVPAGKPPAEPRTPRQRCYAEVMAEAPGGMSRYYFEFSERLGDQRSKDAQEWSLRGMKRIIAILDKYQITDFDNRAQDGSEEKKPTL